MLTSSNNVIVPDIVNLRAFTTAETFNLVVEFADQQARDKYNFASGKGVGETGLNLRLMKSRGDRFAKKGLFGAPNLNIYNSVNPNPLEVSWSRVKRLLKFDFDTRMSQNNVDILNASIEPMTQDLILGLNIDLKRQVIDTPVVAPVAGNAVRIITAGKTKEEINNLITLMSSMGHTIEIV